MGSAHTGEPQLGDVIRAEVRQLEHLGIVEGTPLFDAAVLLLASTVVGPSIQRLAQVTGLSERDIVPRAIRLRRAGTWRDNEVVVAWEDELSGDQSFLADVLVAEGIAVRALPSDHATAPREGC